GDLTPVTRTLYLASLALAGALVLAALLRLRRNRDEISRDRLIALTIVSMPLLMPFYFDYDLLLLSAAAALVAREQIASDRPVEIKTLAAWAALYFWMIFNPAVAGATRVNGTVLILSLLAGTMIRRALVSDVAESATTSEIKPLRQAA